MGLNIETIKRLHTIYEDMILGNIKEAHKDLSIILEEQYLILEQPQKNK